MKLLNILFLLVALTFVSCGSKNNAGTGDGTPEGYIETVEIGKARLNNKTIQMTAAIFDDVTYEGRAIDCMTDNIITLRENGIAINEDHEKCGDNFPLDGSFQANWDVWKNEDNEILLIFYNLPDNKMWASELHTVTGVKAQTRFRDDDGTYDTLVWRVSPIN